MPRADERDMLTAMFESAVRLRAAAPCLALLLLACEPKIPHVLARGPAPHPDGSAPRMDIAFCLDSTGSMQELIDEAKNRIREIDAELRAANPSPSVRFAVVAYRDRGEDYVTRLYDFDPDVRRVEEALGEIEAEGGGDTPEHVVAGLQRAVHDLDWDPEAAVKFLFLVGDAEPHLDYGEESDVEPILATARERDIVIGSLVYGDQMSEAGHEFWTRVAGENAHLTEGVAGAEGGFESMLLFSIRREAQRTMATADEGQEGLDGETTPPDGDQNPSERAPADEQ